MLVYIKTGKIQSHFLPFQESLSFFLKRPDPSESLCGLCLRVRVTACIVSLLPAFIVKNTRERNKKLKVVDKICLKLCAEWRSVWLFLSLKSASLILHVGCQHLSAAQIFGGRQDMGFSADFLMAP